MPKSPLSPRPFALPVIVAALFCVLAPASKAAEPEPRVVTADFQQVKGPNSHYESYCVGAGRAGELLRASALDHLRDVRENCGFRYLRFHGLFHDDMGVVPANKAPEAPFNFQYVDQVYDAILALGIKPFVELGFMPSPFASGTKTVFWWKANVTPPKDYADWSKLIRDFTEHMEQRHGRDEVKTWFFEVWNEPNHPGFFSSTQEEYFRMYDVSAAAIKGVCADYRVGGPSTAGNAWIPELINHCSSNNVPIDFVSTHTYGGQYAFDEFGKKTQYLKPEPDIIAKAVAGVAAQVKASPKPDLPLYYTEWSASSSSRDPIHDSYISAPYILNALKRSAGLAKAMSYWTFTDVFEEAGPPPTPFHGGFGLINLQGLHKPSYYAYKFLHALGDTELACADPSATVCRSENGVQALVWHYRCPKQDAPNAPFFKRDLPAAPLPPVRIVLTHLPAGKYRLKIYGVGYRRNDVYDAFLAMGSPANPTPEQIRKLAAESDGKPCVDEEVQIGAAGEFDHQLPMQENDVWLVTLEKDKG
jgi:xylan 1,4-beta-xylosidase